MSRGGYWACAVDFLVRDSLREDYRHYMPSLQRFATVPKELKTILNESAHSGFFGIFVWRRSWTYVRHVTYVRAL